MSWNLILSEADKVLPLKSVEFNYSKMKMIEFNPLWIVLLRYNPKICRNIITLDSSSRTLPLSSSNSEC